ncbi:hypothetical protein C8Q75DRAFT_283849 [Abortiporus biennis]|nr:hypothetical protein C8Q75DRAFT_283849 [Abortiporus biennis]
MLVNSVVESFTSNLVMLTLRVPGYNVRIDEYSSSTPTITPRIMDKLITRFPNMVYVLSQGGVLFELHDSNIQLVASSWPQLQSFQLDPTGCRWVLPSKPTLASLEFFARYCPRITLISFHMHADGSSIDLKARKEGQSGLKYLNVGDSSIENPYGVAGFCFWEFPRLLRIVGGKDSVVWNLAFETLLASRRAGVLVETYLPHN